MTISNKQLKNDLRKLKGTRGFINPDKTWVEENRRALLASIQNEAPATVSAPQAKESRVVLYGEVLRSLFPLYTISNAARPVMASVLVVVMSIGGWITTVSASHKSLPGDFLYSVKLVAEDTQIAVAKITGGVGTVATLRAERAGRRFEEVRQIALVHTTENKTTVTQEEVNKNVQRAVNDAKNELETLAKDLEKVKQINPTEALAIAFSVDQKVENFANVVKKTKDDIKDSSVDVTPESTVTRSLNEVDAVLAVAQVKTSEVIVEKYAEDVKAGEGQDTEPIVAADILRRHLDNKIEEVTQVVEDASATNTPKVQETIIEAKKLLADDNFTAVVEKVAEVKQIVLDADKKAAAAEEADKEKLLNVGSTETAPAPAAQKPVDTTPTEQSLDVQ